MDDPYINIKKKILYSYYLWPGLLVLFILVSKLTYWPSINIYGGPAVIVAVLFNSLIAPWRYISSFELSQTDINIKYLLPTLKESTYQISLNIVVEVIVEHPFLG